MPCYYYCYCYYETLLEADLGFFAAPAYWLIAT